MILNNLNTYHHTSNLPFTPSQKKNAKIAKYYFEWAEGLDYLKEIQQFRATQFSTQFDMQFSNDLDQDAYDLTCKHAVLRDSWSNEIIAYTRVQFFHGHEIKHSYSQHEFCIEQTFLETDRIVELGRTCVHPRYRSGKTLSILWVHIFRQFVLEMKANYLMGCVSVKLLGNEAKAYYTHQYIQQLNELQSCNIQSKVSFEPQHPQHSFVQDEKIPKLFDIYLKMNGRLSKQAYYDHKFNCLDYLVLMEVNKMENFFND